VVNAMNESVENINMGPYTVLQTIKKNPWGTEYEVLDETKQDPSLSKHLLLLNSYVVNQDNFLLRFELVKGVVKSINSNYLSKYLTFDHCDGLYFLVKENVSIERRPLSCLTIDDNTQKHPLLLRIGLDLAKAMLALKEIDTPIFKNGLPPWPIHPDSIYVGKDDLKICDYLDLFLFYGDEPGAFHQYFLDLAPSLMSYQNIFPFQYRQKVPFTEEHTVYQWAAIMYTYLSGTIPKGDFPKLSSSHPFYPAYWSEILEKVFSQKITSLQSLITELTPHTRPLKKQTQESFVLKDRPIPKGMKPIFLSEKVTLGAMDGPLDEQPAFKIQIPSFFMDIFPITCKEFEQFMPNYTRSSYSSQDNSPATLITLAMAKAYCQWRSIKEGLSPDTYRLPTEYEWEAAVRGITGEQYPWPEEDKDTFVYCGFSNEHGSRPIAQVPPARFEISELLGNVWEWTDSRYTPHPFSTHFKPTYAQKNLKVIKGGSWITPKSACRASLRKAVYSTERRGDISFRCVRAIF
jgi:formylglycine-generating enzyme required for sulfatase activity